MIQPLPLASIVIDRGTQLRRQHCDDAIEEYAARYAAGLSMPPVEIITDGAEFFLVDGFHRYWAAQKAGLAEIEANVETGSLRQAILKACGANSAHGIRRSNADKRRAVSALLYDPEWSQWSDRSIAEACNVDHKTVAAIRAAIASTGEIPASTERMGSDGKTRKLPKPAPVDAPEEDINDLLDFPGDDEGETEPRAPEVREAALAPRDEHAVVVRCPTHEDARAVHFALKAMGYDCYVWEGGE